MEIHEPIHSKSALTLYPKKCTAIVTANSGRKTRKPHAAEREIPNRAYPLRGNCRWVPSGKRRIYGATSTRPCLHIKVETLSCLGINLSTTFDNVGTEDFSSASPTLLSHGFATSISRHSTCSLGINQPRVLNHAENRLHDIQSKMRIAPNYRHLHIIMRHDQSDSCV